MFWTFGLFPLFSIANNAAINTFVHVSLCKYARFLMGSTPRRGIAGPQVINPFSALVDISKLLLNNS